MREKMKIGIFKKKSRSIIKLISNQQRMISEMMKIWVKIIMKKNIE
jgi:hypothetical protein